MTYSHKPSSRKLLLAIAACCGVLVLAACSPQVGNGGSAEDKQSDEIVVEVSWSADGDCGACHDVEQASLGDSACEASLHADIACTQCHDDVSTLATVHESKTTEDKVAKRLKKTEVSDDLCLSCHYETHEALIEATADVVVTDSEGTSRNPHDVGDVVEHEDIACADCHNMHDTEPLEERAKDKCLSCHHEDVFECHTCHN